MMTESFSHQTYISPFTWRYGSPEMRQVWSEIHKRRLWRRLWVALAEAQQSLGMVTPEQVSDLRSQVDNVDIDRAHQIETEIHHDLMAEVKSYAEQCPAGGGIIHLGATSMDIEDNAEALRIQESLDLILIKLTALLGILADQIDRWANQAIIGYTHLQPAEPTTLGYRLAQYGYDLLTDYHEIRRIRLNIRGKGFKGAVGTSASYSELLHLQQHTAAETDRWDTTALETKIMSSIGLKSFPVTTQTYPRKQDWLVTNSLAGLAGSLYKFAFDLRVLQNPRPGRIGRAIRS
jgi:adenylosuccinate lyase